MRTGAGVAPNRVRVAAALWLIAQHIEPCGTISGAMHRAVYVQHWWGNVLDCALPPAGDWAELEVDTRAKDGSPPANTYIW